MSEFYECCDEISVLSIFLRDIEEKGELESPIKELVVPPVIKRIKFLIKRIENGN